VHIDLHLVLLGKVRHGPKVRECLLYLIQQYIWKQSQLTRTVKEMWVKQLICGSGPKGSVNCLVIVRIRMSIEDPDSSGVVCGGGEKNPLFPINPNSF
jgi:hypothetical protein